MKLDDAKEHLQELLRICQGKADLDKDYLRRVVKFNNDFKTWIPEVFIAINDGMIESIHSNCNLHPHVIDKDDLEYEYSLEHWNDEIDDDLQKGIIKQIL
jgi:hypothetical protein